MLFKWNVVNQSLKSALRMKIYNALIVAHVFTQKMIKINRANACSMKKKEEKVYVRSSAIRTFAKPK